MDEFGDAWKNTCEPAESVNAPELYAKFLKKREASDVPYYDIENEMWKNLPYETVGESKLEELAGYTDSVGWGRCITEPFSFSDDSFSSSEDEV